MAGRDRLLGVAFAVCVGVATGIYAFQEPLRQEAEGLPMSPVSAPAEVANKQGITEEKPPSPDAASRLEQSDPKKPETDPTGAKVDTRTTSGNPVAPTAGKEEGGEKGGEGKKKWGWWS